MEMSLYLDPDGSPTDPLPGSFSVTNNILTQQVVIKVYAETDSELSVGTHVLTVREVDTITGFVKTTWFLLEVGSDQTEDESTETESNDESTEEEATEEAMVEDPVVEIIEEEEDHEPEPFVGVDIEEVDEELEEEALLEALEEALEEEEESLEFEIGEEESKNDEEDDIEEEDEELEEIESLIEVSDDGKLIYPWQQSLYYGSFEGVQETDEVEEEEPLIKQLTANILSIS